MPENTPPADPAAKSMEDIVSLCKRRGFVYPASEIYGGINGFWDYGPLGTALKNNIRDHWWQRMVTCPPIDPDTGEPITIVGLDSAIIQNPKTWQASGHVGGFTDPRVDCTETQKRYRADHLLVVKNRTDSGANRFYAFFDEETELRAHKQLAKYENVPLPLSNHHVTPLLDIPFSEWHRVVGPHASEPGTLTEAREFNLMFESETGAVSGETMTVYLRPETAQGIFLNYKNVLDTMRVKVPFGIAQIGKSFRNEVTPRNFIFRSREFEQMEMEWFCPPDESQKWYEFWKTERMKWWRSLGVSPDNLRYRDHDEDELAHYSKMCVDVEYKYPFTAPGFGELEGVAHRGCFDLTAHSKHNNRESNADLHYFDQELQVRLQKEGVPKDEIKQRSKYIPHVIEPASGLTRAVLVMLCEAYTVDSDRPSGMYMKFPAKFAPITAGIFPLVAKDGMPEKAHSLYMQLREKYAVQLDVKQNIGKRYARMDEAGTPFCVTIDGDTMADDTVTVRHRDDQAQERINISQVDAFLAERV